MGRIAAWVVVLICVATLAFAALQVTQGTAVEQRYAPRGFSGLLAAAPTKDCPFVQDLGVHLLDVPRGEHFAYDTAPFGGLCGAELHTSQADVEIVSSRPVVWAAAYDVAVNGRPAFHALMLSYGNSLTMTQQTFSDRFGTSFTATPRTLYVFGLPNISQALDQASAMLALRDSFPQVEYYPVAETSGNFGVPLRTSVTDAILQGVSGMK